MLPNWSEQTACNKTNRDFMVSRLRLLIIHWGYVEIFLNTDLFTKARNQQDKKDETVLKADINLKVYKDTLQCS